MTLYVLVNNGEVLNGPRGWNYRSFESTLEDDLEIELKLPMKKEDDEIFIVDDNTKIYPAEMQYQDYNARIEHLHGPFWDFSTGKAIGTFEKRFNDIDAIKNDLKAKVAETRWTKEVAGVKTTVQGQEVSLDTSRDGRNIFVQKLLLMTDDETVKWKFPEGWFVLIKQELAEVVAAGAAHIQMQFEWEAVKIQEIDACANHDELSAFEYEEKAER